MGSEIISLTNTITNKMKGGKKVYKRILICIYPKEYVKIHVNSYLDDIIMSTTLVLENSFSFRRICLFYLYLKSSVVQSKFDLFSMVYKVSFKFSLHQFDFSVITYHPFLPFMILSSISVLS